MAKIKIPTIRFIDLIEREKSARFAITDTYTKLKARLDKTGRLSETDSRELERVAALQELIDKDPLLELTFDPLFAAVAEELASDKLGLAPIEVSRSKRGVLKFIGPADDEPEDDIAERSERVARVGLILGLLQYYGSALPRLVEKDSTVKVDREDPNLQLFGESLFRAIGRIAGRLELAARTLTQVASAVDIVGDGDSPAVSSLEYARVFEGLVGKGVSPNDANLKRFVESEFDQVQDLGSDRPMHEIAIDLPDLEATTDAEVVASHCKNFGSFIFASAFEELKAFQVVDKLVEMSQRGELALIKGPAGTQLYRYWRDAPNRMSEIERQSFYAMTLGLPSGQPGTKVNFDFQDLWLRFVSSVSTLVREARVDQLLRSATPAAINQQHVKKAARDLATNMSANGYGMVFYAAADLQKQINDMITLLQDKELQLSMGARDMWGVIDQVAATELGGARNGSRYRMLATSGAIITSWLALNTARLRDPTIPMISLRDVENPPARAKGETAVSNPTDYDLVNACEMWLADSAMDEGRVEQMSQSRESPNTTSRPIQIPSIARDLLDNVGLGMGMGLGVNQQRPAARQNGYAGY